MMSERQTGQNPRTEGRGFRRIMFGLAAVLGLCLVTTLATLFFGLNGGEEFSPATFSRRSFYYYEIPLLGLQVTPITREDETSVLESLVKAKSYVVADKSGTPRWDLVAAYRSGTPKFRGGAAILCDYLDATDQGGTLYWKLWTEQHPELAAVFWPQVARVARQQLYLFVPDLFDKARSATTPEALAGMLQASLAEQYQRLADIQQGLGQPAVAADLRKEAASHASASPKPNG